MSKRYQACFLEPDPFTGSRYALGARLRGPGGVTFVSWPEDDVAERWRPLAALYRDRLKRDPRATPGPLLDVMRWQDVPDGVADVEAWVRQIGEPSYPA